METLTKAWVAKHRGAHQRSVDEMEAHRSRFGASGNCFDLAVWLRHRLSEAGVEAWFVGHHVTSKDAHVAVAAADGRGRIYLCDLGDLWLQPVAVTPSIETPLRGFFPGADIATCRNGDTFAVDYFRFGGKKSSQEYKLSPVPDDVFFRAAETNQAYLVQLLVEMRDASNLAHWEYINGVARWSRHSGLSEETVDGSIAASEAIAARTGMNAEYVAECLVAFDELQESSRP